MTKNKQQIFPVNPFATLGRKFLKKDQKTITKR